jgi:hypothetical protein
MSEWFYTTNKQQMGPVSFDELKELATRGMLRPTDLVWRDGMRDWMKASTQGLFDEKNPAASPASARASAGGKPARWDTEEDRPRRSSRRTDEDEEDGDRPRRRRFRDEGMPVGVKVGLILGGVVLLLAVVGVIIFVVADSGGGGAPVGGGPVGLGTYNGFLTWNDPRDTRMRNPCKIYTVALQANKTYHIELRAKTFDAYLRLEDSNFFEVAANDDGARGRPFCGPLDSLIVYTPAKSDNFRVVATSLNGQTGNLILNIQEGPPGMPGWKK